MKTLKRNKWGDWQEEHEVSDFAAPFPGNLISLESSFKAGQRIRRAACSAIFTLF